METVIAHEIEAVIAGPPPRMARLPWRTQGLLLLAGTLTLLLFIGGARALEEAGRLAWIALVGRPAIAQITAIDIAPEINPKQPVQQTGLTYRYVDPQTGQMVSRHTRLVTMPSSPDGGLSGIGGPERIPPPPLLHLGQRLELRVAGGPSNPVIYFWSPAPWGKGLFLTLCGLAVMAVSLRLMLALSRWQRLRVRLLRSGYSVVGTIVHKRADVGDTPRYYLRYGYATVGAVEAREHEEQVNAEQWKAFEIGQPVTVLYDPDAPASAGLYALMR